MTEPQIYIRGFPKSTTQKDLKTHFDKIGDIKQVRIINAYAFIGYSNPDHAHEAVKQLNSSEIDGYKLRVQIAGEPRKKKGPQPNDQCRNCGKLGHWRSTCPQRRRQRDRRRRERSRNRSSSSESSQQRDRRRRVKRHSRRRKYSSSSSSSSSDSSSSSSSRSSSSSSKSLKKRTNKREQKK